MQPKSRAERRQCSGALRSRFAGAVRSAQGGAPPSGPGANWTQWRQNNPGAARRSSKSNVGREKTKEAILEDRFGSEQSAGGFGSILGSMWDLAGRTCSPMKGNTRAAPAVRRGIARLPRVCGTWGVLVELRSEKSHCSGVRVSMDSHRAVDIGPTIRVPHVDPQRGSHFEPERTDPILIHIANPSARNPR